IQAAVGLCHFNNGNRRGARKLYGTSKAYMAGYPGRHLGLDLTEFWRQMGDCFAPVLAGEEPPADAELDPDRLPRIDLDPPAARGRARAGSWPPGEGHGPGAPAMNGATRARGRFAGSAGLFPLRNLVLSPHVAQPLHVFEPRYRRLTADTLAGDRLMAVVL